MESPETSFAVYKRVYLTLSLGEPYQNLVASGMKPARARLTLARKIAAIVLKIWKKGGRFDPEQLKRQAG